MNANRVFHVSSNLRSCAIAVLATLSVTCATAPRSSAQYYHLGFLNQQGFGPTIAYGVSHDGKVVVGQSVSNMGFEGFVWTPTLGMRGLGDLPGGAFSSVAYAAADNGVAAVGASNDCCSETGAPCAFIRPHRIFELPGLHGPTSYGAAFDVTPDGRIAVGSSENPNGGIDAILWDRVTGMHNLGDLPGGQENATATAISSDGMIVVGNGSWNQPPFNVAFKWTAQSGMVALPSAGGGITSAADISADGTVIVGQMNGHAGRWTEQTGWVDLGTYGIRRGVYFATGTNRDGSIIVGLGNYDGIQGTGEAFIWDQQHGIRSLASYIVNERHLSFGDLPPFWGRAISDDGKVIVGYGFNGHGEQEGFALELQN